MAYNGQCEAAFKVYEQCLGGQITLMMMYESSPIAASRPGVEGQDIVHAKLKVGPLSRFGLGELKEGGTGPSNAADRLPLRLESKAALALALG